CRGALSYLRIACMNASARADAGPGDFGPGTPCTGSTWSVANVGPGAASRRGTSAVHAFSDEYSCTDIRPAPRAIALKSTAVPPGTRWEPVTSYVPFWNTAINRLLAPDSAIVTSAPKFMSIEPSPLSTITRRS